MKISYISLSLDINEWTKNNKQTQVSKIDNFYESWVITNLIFPKNQESWKWKTTCPVWPIVRPSVMQSKNKRLQVVRYRRILFWIVDVTISHKCFKGARNRRPPHFFQLNFVSTSMETTARSHGSPVGQTQQN